jgi:hypothetical protein
MSRPLPWYKKTLFILLAVILSLAAVEGVSYLAWRLLSPPKSQAGKPLSKDHVFFRTDYRGNDFSGEDYDYRQDCFGPYLQDSSLKLWERLIGPRACEHYMRLDNFTLFPFTMFHFQRNYRSQVVNTNSLGFRARNLADYNKDPKPKIILLGGSAAFGTYASSDAHTLTAQLEAALARRGFESTCINLAMGGFTSEQEMITLARIGLRLHPVAVLAVDGANDLLHYSTLRDAPFRYGSLARLYQLGTKGHARLLATTPRFYLQGLVHSLGDYCSFFALVDLLSQRRSLAAASEAEGLEPCTLFADESDEQALIDNFLNSHRVMFSLCKARNIRYYGCLQAVAGIWVEPRWEGEKPYDMRRDAKFVQVYRKLDQALAEQAAREGFPYLNLGKILAAADNTYNFSDNLHLTDKSNAVLGEYLAGRLLGELKRAN